MFKHKKNILTTSIILLMILLSGFAIGRITGIHILEKVISGGKYSLLLYRPPFEYMYTANLLSNPDELKRLEGYYSLMDKNLIDTELLFKRYKDESLINRSAIIWLLGYSGNKTEVRKFLSEEYSKSDNSLKRKILRAMRQLDVSYYKDFIKKNKIDESKN